MIWKKEFTIEGLNKSENNMVKHLGIEFSAFGEDYLEATMPVDKRTLQPFGVLHGGASVVLAETIGSMAGYLCLADLQKTTVGQEINANHLRAARSGVVTGRATPIHIGRQSQVWSIEIKNEEGKLVAISRLTLAVIEMK
ncbi:MAG: 1,4-dihydroxy-2-naphthoyl-CoA hydrolase [Chitinophagales bacterium]|jgi:1,4-dihydroxy-2-naphthoyl-CoA hydrolase